MQSYSYLLGSHKGMVPVLRDMLVIHRHYVYGDQIPSAWTTIILVQLYSSRSYFLGGGKAQTGLGVIFQIAMVKT